MSMARKEETKVAGQTQKENKPERKEVFGTLQDKPAKLRRYCDPFFCWFLLFFFLAPENHCCTSNFARADCKEVEKKKKMWKSRHTLTPHETLLTSHIMELMLWVHFHFPAMTSCSPVMPVAWLEDVLYSPNFTTWRRIIPCFHPQNWLSAIHTPT